MKLKNYLTAFFFTIIHLMYNIICQRDKQKKGKPENRRQGRKWQEQRKRDMTRIANSSRVWRKRERGKGCYAFKRTRVRECSPPEFLRDDKSQGFFSRRGLICTQNSDDRLRAPRVLLPASPIPFSCPSQGRECWKSAVKVLDMWRTDREGRQGTRRVRVRHLQGVL